MVQSARSRKKYLAGIRFPSWASFSPEEASLSRTSKTSPGTALRFPSRAEARERVAASRAVVEEILRGDRVVYGINTGFGNFRNVVIARGDLEELQLNLVRSHSAGVGNAFPEPVVRSILLLRANTLAAGYSGIDPGTLDALIAMLNAGVHPVVPEKGSVGASGDLAPLAHVALTLIGEGEADFRGERLSSRAALGARGAFAGEAPSEGRARAHQRDPGDLGGSRGHHRRRAAARALGRRHRSAHSRRAFRHRRRLRSAHPRGATSPGTGGVGAEPAATSLWKRAPEVARRVRPRPGQLFPPLHAASPRRGKRRARLCDARPRDRDEQRDRQPDDLRRRERGALRRELPRPAGGARVGLPHHRPRGSSAPSASGASSGW